MAQSVGFRATKVLQVHHQDKKLLSLLPKIRVLADLKECSLHHIMEEKLPEYQELECVMV